MAPHTPHSHRQTRFPQQFSPRFPTAESQVAHSIKQFIHSRVTQKEPDLVAPRKDSQQRKKIKSLGFYTLTVFPHASLTLPPESLVLAPLCVHPPCWNHKSSSPSLSKRLAIPSFSQCPCTQLAVTSLRALCYPKGWQFTISRLQFIHLILKQTSIVNFMALYTSSTPLRSRDLFIQISRCRYLVLLGMS